MSVGELVCKKCSRIYKSVDVQFTMIVQAKIGTGIEPTQFGSEREEGLAKVGYRIDVVSGLVVETGEEVFNISDSFVECPNCGTSGTPDGVFESKFKCTSCLKYVETNHYCSWNGGFRCEKCMKKTAFSAGVGWTCSTCYARSTCEHAVLVEVAEYEEQKEMQPMLEVNWDALYEEMHAGMLFEDEPEYDDEPLGDDNW